MLTAPLINFSSQGLLNMEYVVAPDSPQSALKTHSSLSLLNSTVLAVVGLLL